MDMAHERGALSSPLQQQLSATRVVLPPSRVATPHLDLKDEVFQGRAKDLWQLVLIHALVLKGSVHVVAHPCPHQGR